ncbi:L-isoaspartate O-methyltransferase [Micractinium conductrix]|uniref:protein-L-isoaspartate(D-aspartate) O-methyltransferase n=1 Tax=Micractinium conductrix TaxID=554055 RepID=A0A2P6VDA3_9CHLO|nr:L-isoaspartate O-methyltransferase [Micractinium conductrix]|eukprot:PSC72076.1 L-isoaspartate O-methyltransferase [Micractinium conductrix]
MEREPPHRLMPDASDSEEEEGLDMDEEEDGDEPMLAARGRGAGANAQHLPLHHFLRLIAGGRMMEHRGAAATNDDLVANLRRGGVIQSDRVARALRLCPRDLFVPAQHKDEALIDAPIRVEAHDFNISAPHMHAACLEALQLQPGHKFLDAGSGCGLLTAAGAVLVGRSGAAVGFDVRRECVSMGRDAVKRLTSSSPEFAASACAVRFEHQNCYMPAHKFVGAFDRVHVGASCPPNRLAPLLLLLKPEGGLIVVPVSPNDLRLITKRPNGSVTQRVISQVRFSDLDVPTDADILLATLCSERRTRTAPATNPSTYAEDVQAIMGAASSAGGSLSATPSGSYSDACGAYMPSTSPTNVIDSLPATPTGVPTPTAAGERSWPHRLSKLFSSCSSGGSSSDGTMDAGMQPGSPLGPPRLFLDELGEPDCVLEGAGWSIPVHRSVLRQRCDHFRARCTAGWADADAQRVAVPEQFGEAAVRAFLHYVYNDDMEDCREPQEAVAVLHVALFYACPRLVHLCELRLATLLRGRERRAKAHEHDEEALADAAAALLALADDNGLFHLKNVALDYIVHNHAAVAATESYAHLSRSQVALVAEEACAALGRAMGHVKRMADLPMLPEPSY